MIMRKGIPLIFLLENLDDPDDPKIVIVDPEDEGEDDLEILDDAYEPDDDEDDLYIDDEDFPLNT